MPSEYYWLNSSDEFANVFWPDYFHKQSSEELAAKILQYVNVYKCPSTYGYFSMTNIA